MIFQEVSFSRSKLELCDKGLHDNEKKTFENNAFFSFCNIVFLDFVKSKIL